MGIIRLLLALSVALNHSYFLYKVNFLGGALAVQAFFIISGFYMSLILNEKYLNKEGSYKLFITNRFMRIYPLYIVVLILSVSFYGLSFLYSSPDFRNSVMIENPIQMFTDHSSNIGFSTLLFLAFTNIFIFFQDVLMFLSIDVSGNIFFTANFRLTEFPLYKFLFIPQAWSIAIECMFYLIAPFLLRRNIKLIAALIAITFLFRFITYYNGFSNDPWSYRFFPFELGYFLLGNVSYLIYKKIQTISLNPNYLWAVFIFILCLTILYPVIKFKGSEYLYTSCFVLCLPFVFFLSKGWKYDTYMGDLSYPIYLVHLLVLSMVKHLAGSIDDIYLRFIYILSVLAFSVLLNELISKKVDRIRQKRYIKFQNITS